LEETMPLALLPEEVRLKNLDRTRRRLAELSQRWDNRLTNKNISFSKEYVKARLSVALYFPFLSSLERQRRRAKSFKGLVLAGGALWRASWRRGSRA
jgi:hypothetical protein